MDKEQIGKLIKTYLEEGMSDPRWYQVSMDAYLDIETTGLCPSFDQITIVGIYLIKGTIERLVQIVGADITAHNIIQSLDGVSTIFTYNGSRFDLPFIYGLIGIDLKTIADHRDLMYDCWRCNLKGGFKAVEQQLGIPRQLKSITGWDAVMLWRRYQKHGDQKALDLLLQYNKEDVLNLKVLRKKLGVEAR